MKNQKELGMYDTQQKPAIGQLACEKGFGTDWEVAKQEGAGGPDCSPSAAKTGAAPKMPLDPAAACQKCCQTHLASLPEPAAVWRLFHVDANTSH